MAQPGDCAICCESLLGCDDDNNTNVVSTPCGHIFHQACISQALEYTKSCPHCRARILPSQVHPIYLPLNNTTATNGPGTSRRISESMNSVLLAANKEQAQVIMDMKTTLASTKERNTILERKLAEAQHQSAELFGEKIRMERECERLLHERSASNFFRHDSSNLSGEDGNSNSGRPPIPVDRELEQLLGPGVPQNVMEFLRTSRTLASRVKLDLDRTQKRLRDLEAENLTLKKKVHKYKSMAVKYFDLRQGDDGKGQPGARGASSNHHISSWVADVVIPDDDADVIDVDAECPQDPAPGIPPPSSGVSGGAQLRLVPPSGSRRREQGVQGLVAQPLAFCNRT